MRAAVSALVLAVAWLAASEPAFAQCAACREALKSSGAGGLIRGFFVSTMILTTTPVLLMGALAYAIARSARRKARESVEPTTHA